MAQKYQQIEINKEEFKNLVTRKNRQRSQIFWKQITAPISNRIVQNIEL